MAATKKTVMVVDDEPDVRETSKTVLEQNGYKVVGAESADDALKKLKAGEKPDLILLDIMMPGMPVKEFTSKVKDVKICFLSVVRTSDAEKEQLMKDGSVVDYINKPFDVDTLLKRVKKILG